MNRKSMGGGDGNRTRVQGFAGPCLSHSATPPQGRLKTPSGRRDSNPRPSPWQGDALPAEPRPHVGPRRPRACPPDLSGAASELYPILAQPPTRTGGYEKKSVRRTKGGHSVPTVYTGQVV